ncbi:MAG TPA: N-acetyl-D-Glu racemase DgcA [Hyphomicrobium sp.]|nr:N-acetyl-D-Glu racemase DgcA [Hyphomicrobium sp.]
MASGTEAHLIEATAEAWPLARPFVIARGAKTEAHVVVAHVAAGGHSGRGEAVPYARYGETVEGALDALRALSGPLTRASIAAVLPPGAARNALDCALWDLEAKRAGKRAWQIAGVPAPQPALTCYTLSLGTPEEMANQAASVPHLKLLKLKLGGDGDDARMHAVRHARPDARLVADANEAWRADQLGEFLAAAAASGMELIEQPLPAGSDAALAEISHPVPICADESAHTAADLPQLAGRYDAVNIKLDKTGGLTQALAMAKAAKASGFKIMVGSMVATSLAAAPALLMASYADWVDLDGPLLLARDRIPPLAIAAGIISPPAPELWG